MLIDANKALMKIVVLISANAEWRSVKSLFPTSAFQASPFGEWFESKLFSPYSLLVTFFHGGWGKISAVATAQYVIDHFQPDLLVNLGTSGGFEGRIETGTIILVEKTIVYDIIEQMGDAAEAIDHYSTDIDLSWLGEDCLPSAVRGLMVSGDRDIVVEDIPLLIEKYGAVAADWESGAIAWVANKNRVRCLILRGVSDLVGGNGGEAYGNVGLFHQRTAEIMQRLVSQLGEWLNSAITESD
jgi:adenosylhomocysteine nucleosidase